MKVYGGDYDYYGYQADGGNFMSCVGDGNHMTGADDGDSLYCEGNACGLWGRGGNDDLTVVNPDGPGAPGTDTYTWMLNVRCRVHRHTRNHSRFSSGRRRHRHVHVQRQRCRR